MRSTVRPATVDDAAGIATMWVRSWQAAYRGLLDQVFLDGLDGQLRSGERARRLAELIGSGPERTSVLVATAEDAGAHEDTGGVVGFVNAGPARDDDADPALTGEVRAIYLLPAAWGHGAGRALMAEACRRLAGHRFSTATLWVLEANARARRFYEAAGWVADGTQTTRIGREWVPELRYRRSLPDSPA